MSQTCELHSCMSKTACWAAAAAIATASKSVNDLRIAEVSELDMKLENGKVAGYRAKVKVSFKFRED